jgi:hypothetical protein
VGESASRVEALEYFNSATVMAIIQSIHAARANGVKMRIVYDEKTEWQKLSFEPMRVLAKDHLLELCPLSALDPGASSRS